MVLLADPAVAHRQVAGGDLVRGLAHPPRRREALAALRRLVSTDRDCEKSSFNQCRYRLSMNLSTWLRQWWIASLLGTALVALVVLCSGLWGSWDSVSPFCCWLTKDESGSTTIRNIGLVIAAVVALTLTIRRISVADSQVKTSQQGLLYDRYQKGAEMLGSSVLAVRLGGIYALQRLATEEPTQFLHQVVRQYCAFARHPPKHGGSKSGGTEPTPEANPTFAPEDVRTVMNAIVDFLDHPEPIDEAGDLTLDLRGANLSDLDLSGAQLHRANLSRANLVYADLSGAILTQADVSDANLLDANVSGTKFSQGGLSQVRGLTQDQLDAACADPENPPELEGVVDQKGLPLRWRGRPCLPPDDW